ncbi:uncharacterized protein L969DRAFT_93176 [Mixia osmundae IAM 14324]|uniref:Uncharacterized protein n=1 Tax=Mixia osmundae (strain CBS 9802 / IAM 14324 / JCM 22182 / KY 12970) TaxID=764103 RepID=G7E5V6_MIXOS|nr:uncharacterized protein L969DRAFT_93176 [Mixia osmundae IAM 14324]KEI40632.1 hypothetical protein L969DRAFT_93176 [Mixia osmundae IAM 14324]GAA98216.1 hypothetical protein E5Q_04899 [Mixia osmundae IAM 14324]
MRLSASALALLALTMRSSVSAFDIRDLSSSTPLGESSIYFCKCICFSNYTIVPLYRPNDPSKPCLSCTKQFCLDQKLGICKDAEKGETDLDTATGEEGDVTTKCFQRDSVLSRFVIMSFIGITAGLLLSASVKDRLPALLSRYGIAQTTSSWAGRASNGRQVWEQFRARAMSATRR